jgi:hypothetical protein
MNASSINKQTISLILAKIRNVPLSIGHLMELYCSCKARAWMKRKWRHDTQPNVIQHNTTMHNKRETIGTNDTKCKHPLQPVSLFSMSFYGVSLCYSCSECPYAECGCFCHIFIVIMMLTLILLSVKLS